MARPPAYYTKDRQRVPSVTTIIKHIETDNEGLLRWAHRLGTEGVPLEQAREQAAGVGSIVHAAIEADLKQEPPLDLSGVDEESRRQVDASMAAWKLWRETSGMTAVLDSESSLVSEELRFGGTMDAVLVVQGRRVLFDFKTGARLYPKDLVQIAGYGLLWDEHHPAATVEQFTLLRLDKESAGFTWKHLSAEQLAPAFEAFRQARALYDLARTITKMVA